MWEERTLRAQRDIVALGVAGLGVGQLHAAAIEMVERQVKADLTCWATIDPQMLVISGMTSGVNLVPPEYEPALAAAEYGADEPNQFATLAERRAVVARLSDLPARERHRSMRLNTVWRPLGLDSELRVMFRAGGACWGAAGLARGGRDFGVREIEFFAALAPAIASATRLAVRREAARSPLTDQPAIVVIGPHGEILSTTSTARNWRAGLDEIAPQRFATMMQVMASGARASATGGFRARLRDADGHWAFLRASTLLGLAEHQVAVTIEPATGDQLTGLLVEAYGLTARERDICSEVILGRSTTEIAGRLFIANHTVQDHLKSIFTKVDVRSRGELVARLRPEVNSTQPGRRPSR